MILYVVRHGETKANAKDILQGPHNNGPLTEFGVKQIEEVAPRIPPEIEIIYCSHLKRVVQSAEILNRALGVEIIKRDDLKERDYGSLAGRERAELGNLKEIDERLQYDYRPYGGESVEDVRKRIAAFLEEVKRSRHERILVVTSRGVIMMLYKMLHGRIVTEVPNGSLHYFENLSL